MESVPPLPVQEDTLAPPPPSVGPAGDHTLTAPMPITSARPAWRDTFISLRIPNFRRFAISHLIAVVAVWMQRIAQDWMVLELSGSVTAVGITPGGVGLTESTTVLALVNWGADSAAAAAGVFLFSIFTHLMEVPLGALGWLVWSLSPRVRNASGDDPEEQAGAVSPG